jgi:site-specific recombinase XerD
MLNNQDFPHFKPKCPAKRGSNKPKKHKLNQSKTTSPSRSSKSFALLEKTMARIDGAYAPSSIRAYRADFLEFIHFCEAHKGKPIPATPIITAKFIAQLSAGTRASASIRRAVASISTIHRLNRVADPTKDPDVLLEMRRMHRKKGRACKQAKAINAETLERLLNATGDDIRGIRDKALLLLAYDSLCRRSELIAIEINHLDVTTSNGIEHMSVLIKRSKTDQDSMGRKLHLTQRAMNAICDWINLLNKKNGLLFRGINRGGKITEGLGAGQINRIFKALGRKAKLEESAIKGISGHSMRVGHAQDLASSGASLPMIMSKGRWSKTDTVMRYVEQMPYVQ